MARRRPTRGREVPASHESTPEALLAGLDDLAARIGRVADKVEQGAPLRVSRGVVGVTAEVDETRDAGLRFYRCTTPREKLQGTGEFSYELFAEPPGVKSAVELPVGAQYSVQQRVYDAASTTGTSYGPWSIHCCVFKAVVYGIPFAGSGPPTVFTGPSVAQNFGRNFPSVGTLQESGADYSAGNVAEVHHVDAWGAPLGISGKLLASSSTASSLTNHEMTASPGPGWTAIPLLIEDENAMLTALKSLFGGAGAGNGSESITLAHARMCVSTRRSFSVLVTARKSLTISHSRVNMNANWDSGPSTLTRSDATRRNFRLPIFGSQTLVVGRPEV